MKNEKSKNITVDLALLAMVVVTFIFIWEYNVLATIFIIAVYLIRTAILYDKGDHTLYFTGMFFGAAIEITATHCGAWNYTKPAFLNITLWLPFTWGFIAVFITNFARCVVKK